MLTNFNLCTPGRITSYSKSVITRDPVPGSDEFHMLFSRRYSDGSGYFYDPTLGRKVSEPAVHYEVYPITYKPD
jgi:hypothetical protein